MRDEVLSQRLRRLLRHPGRAHSLTDPRFASLAGGAILRRIVGAESAVDGLSLRDLRVAVRAVTQVVLQLDELAVPVLEEQVRSLLNAVIARHTVPSVLALTGWAGGPPERSGLIAARERVTGWAGNARASLSQRSWLPALDAAGALLASLAPISVREAAFSLRAAGITDRLYSPAAVLDLARLVGYDWQLEVVPAPEGPQLLTTAAAQAARDKAARDAETTRRLLAALRRDRIVKLAALTAVVGLKRQRVVEVATATPELTALPGGWVGSYESRQPSMFDNILEQVFAVAPEVTVPVLNEGLARGMTLRGVEWAAPDDILRAYLARRPGVEVDGDVVRCLEPPPLAVLRRGDRTLVAALRASPTRTLTYLALVGAYTAEGLSGGSARVLVARSPVIEPVSYGLYKVRGEIVAVAPGRRRSGWSRTRAGTSSRGRG